LCLNCYDFSSNDLSISANNFHLFFIPDYCFYRYKIRTADIEPYEKKNNILDKTVGGKSYQ